MEPVLFYGVPAGCSFGSIVALEWLEQPYLLSRVGMLEQPWDQLFGKVNPRFQTPALLTASGETLTESIAILNHLVARSPGSSLSRPAGSVEDDQLTEMLAYLNTDFFSAFGPLWTLYEANGLSGEQESLLRSLGRDDVAKQCAFLNGLLADRQWLLGPKRSIADAYLAGVGRWVHYHALFDLDKEYPHLARHLRKLAEDPAAVFAAEIEDGREPTGGGYFRGHVTLDELRSRLAA
ncbi:glutathione S-transferase family protein [Gilvimarinus sp. F26214L]|uniref:glutathione S-transferase family protein n=1 Tax=Gilvimarinus sp. DZF01 TaxID=3461371 RepID=UPI0040464FBB